MRKKAKAKYHVEHEPEIPSPRTSCPMSLETLPTPFRFLPVIIHFGLWFSVSVCQRRALPVHRHFASELTSSNEFYPFPMFLLQRRAKRSGGGREGQIRRMTRYITGIAFSFGCQHTELIIYIWLSASSSPLPSPVQPFESRNLLRERP